MDMNVTDLKRSQLRRSDFGQGAALVVLCVGALLTSQLTNPKLVESDQHRTTSAQSSADQGKVPDSKPPAKPQKELLHAQSSAQESKPAQSKTQTSKSEEPKAKQDKGEQGSEKEKHTT